jgi:hypothetical protein
LLLLVFDVGGVGVGADRVLTSLPDWLPEALASGDPAARDRKKRRAYDTN